MSFLYVCLFSNGHLKVGAAIPCARNEHPYAGSCRETPNREASGCSATASRRPFLLLPRSRLRIEPRGFARLVQRVFLFCA